MISVIGRSTGLAPMLKASSQAVASQVIGVHPPITLPSEKVLIPPEEEIHTHYSLNKLLPRKPITGAISGIGIPGQVRFAHTDIRVPDFTAYRKDACKDPNKPASDSSENRQAFSYLIMAGGGVMAAVAAKGIVGMFVGSMAASADVLALAKIEVKLNSIPEGKNMTLKWRGKPLFVRHRTAEEIQQERSVDVASLRDPQSDAERTTKPEWLVVIGVCTHLGCVPVANAGDYGGYYCPCHGSHYDAAGRIRKGPAPLNLEIPEHEFIESNNTLIVG